MSSNLRCPLMFSLRDEGPTGCIEAECAFWHKYKKQCAVLVIANTFTLFQKFGVGDKFSRSQGGGDRGEF